MVLLLIRDAPGRIDDRVLCIKLPKSETQSAQSKHREAQRNPAVSLRPGLTFYSTGFSVPSVAFLRVLCVKFRKARYENVRFLQIFRRLVVQEIEEEDLSRPANDA